MLIVPAKYAMRRASPPIAAMLAACSPTPRDAVLASPDQPIAVTAGSTPASHARADSPATAAGRRILSTAFVRLGPGGHLSVERRDGRMLALRDITMRPDAYCGTQVTGEKYCGGYAEIAAARADGAPADTPVAPAPDPARPR